MSKTSLVVKTHALEIDASIRHAHIFATFDQLKSGEYMELTNDYDPKLLYYQFMFEREGTFTWEYIEADPTLWNVLIGKK